MKPIIHTANLWRQILPIKHFREFPTLPEMYNTCNTGSSDMKRSQMLHCTASQTSILESCTPFIQSRAAPNFFTRLAKSKCHAATPSVWIPVVQCYTIEKWKMVRFLYHKSQLCINMINRALLFLDKNSVGQFIMRSKKIVHLDCLK